MKKTAWIVAGILALCLCLNGCEKKDDVSENPGGAGSLGQTTAPGACMPKSLCRTE